MVRETIDYPSEALAAICRKHHIRRLAIFGSALRPDFGPDSDVDLLVDFDPATPIGFRIFRIEDELSQIFGGRRVDIIDRQYLNKYLKDRIIQSARVVFEDAHGEG